MYHLQAHSFQSKIDNRFLYNFGIPQLHKLLLSIYNEANILHMLLEHF